MASVIARLSRRNLYLLLLQHLNEKNSNKYKKRFWMRQIFLEREKKGAFNLLIKDMALFDHEYFFKFFRMTPTKYEELLKLVAPQLTRSSLRRKAIGPSERLTVTLKYIFCWYFTNWFISNVSHQQNLHKPDSQWNMCSLWNVLLAEKFLSHPENQEQWEAVALEFEQKWNFHHCIGAIDGKHIVMQAPVRSGSFFFNYKKSHSIVLMTDFL